MNGVREIEESEFPREVLRSKSPDLVDFYAPWCGPCRMLAPALEGLAAGYEGRLRIVKVNVDEAQGLAYEYGIRGVPTLMMFSAGKAVDSMVGLPPLDALKSKLDRLTDSAPAVVASTGAGKAVGS
jgi:thioredoxin 1